MARRYSVETVFKAVDRITRPIGRMQTRVNRFTRSVDAGLVRMNRRMRAFRGGVRSAGIAAGAAFASTAIAAANLIGIGADFEQAMITAAAKFPGEIRKGTKAFEELEAVARRTGSTTEFTATQSADALNFLAMAGFDAQQSIAALPGVVDLATAAGIDLALASDIATDSLGALGLASKDGATLQKNLARVNDLLISTSTSANTTMEQMFEAIVEAGPVAVTAGASVETLAALIGKLADSGIKGSKAGTTLKNAFLRLAAPGDKAKKVLSGLGVKTVDSQGNLRDMIDILGDLDEATRKLGTAEKTAALNAIFGRIPIAGVNVLLDTGADKLNAYRTQLESVDGAAGEMAGTMRNSVRGSLSGLKSVVEGVKIAIFNLNKGPLKDTIDNMTEWVRTNEALIASTITDFIMRIVDNLELIVFWGGLVIKSLAGFWAFEKVLIAIKAAIILVNLATAANPLVLLMIAVIGLATIVWLKWDKIRVLMAEIGGYLTEKLAPAITMVKEAFGSAADWIMGKWQAFMDLLDSIGETLSAIIEKIPFVSLGDGPGLPVMPGADGMELAAPFSGPSGVRPANENSPRSFFSEAPDGSVTQTEIIIRDETGRAEVAKTNAGSGTGTTVKLTSTGAF